MSMPVMTFFPSVAASSTARSCSRACIAATLPQPPAMGVERVVDRSVAGLRPGQSFQRIRVVVEPKAGSSVLQLTSAECGRRCGPDRAVTGDLLRAQVGTERDQLGEVADRLDAPDLLDPHETVRVQIVAEEERRVLILRGEQARQPVVQEVALVDGLDPECVAFLAEPGEDLVPLLCLAGAKHRRPEVALSPSVRGDRLPEVNPGSPTGHVSGPWAAAKFRQAASSAVRV